MSTQRKPLEGQLPLPFMNEEKRTAKPRLVVVRADSQDQSTEPRPVTKTRRRLPKAG